MNRLRFLPSLNIRVRRFALLSLMMLVAGCGTLSVDLATSVESEESFSHTMTITAEGLMAEMMQGELDLSDLQSQGWEASVARDGDRWTLTASGTFAGEQARQFSETSGEDDIFEGFKIEKTETGDAIEYRISLRLEAAEDAASDVTGDATTPGAEGDPFAQLGEAMLQSIADTITVSWELTAPGEIVETNADTFESNKATWDLNLLDFEETTELYAVSRVQKGGGACSGPARRF
ncbi:MAG: hypothetical protein L0177_08810 [Chloroflexi bacterium]|nr:hypothetical protein [Chloroflexota bacterium]